MNPSTHETEGKIPLDRHVGIEGIVLEDHGDVAITGMNVVHDRTGDRDRPFGDLLESGDHPKGGALPTAGWTDEHDEFPIRDPQVKPFDREYASGIGLASFFENNFSH